MPTFRTRLVGVNFRPIECQALVSKLEEGDAVYLIRDPENQYDPNAIKVEASMGADHIGFVAAKRKDDIALASEIAEFMDLDTYYEAYIVADAGSKSPLIEIEIFEEDEVA